MNLKTQKYNDPIVICMVKNKTGKKGWFHKNSRENYIKIEVRDIIIYQKHLSNITDVYKVTYVHSIQWIGKEILH